MDIEELDQEKLAELESMLYCQVFHSKETEDCQPTNPVPMEDNANVKSNTPKAKPRYFEKQSKRPPKKNSDRTWYSKTPEKTKQQQNNPDCTSPIQNNITINHYVYNVPGWSHRNDKEDTVEIVTSLKKKLSARKRPNRKERKEIKQKISEKVREQRKKNRSHVIFISDDEASNDCHTLPEDGGSIDLINDSNSNSNVSSHDDEVLFVPTEPCEVIDLGSDDESAGNQETEQNAATDESSNRKNVDAGKENNNQEGKSDAGVQKLGNDNSKAITKMASNESQESNDFLDSGVVQDSQDCFDFQLHGSEFNQCSGRAVGASTSEQFVMPSKPSGEAHAAENHETESESASSTTTGTDRACSNDFSLKNIVFEEVDFPKADIFADNDLQGFEKLITPQRDDQDPGEGVQEQRVAKEARTPRPSKANTPKGVHTQSPLTPAGAKPQKRGSNAKSAKKRTARTKHGEDPEEEDSSEDSEESSSESEYEGSEQLQRRRLLPELSLMLQPNTPDRKQKRRESSNVDAADGMQKHREAKETRTPRTSKTNTPKAVHTPSPRTPASGKANKGGSSAKSAKKHAFRTGQEERENEGNSSEKRGSENEIESSEVQRQNLLETSAPIVEQKRQESDNADEGQIDIDSPEVDGTENGVSEAVLDENASNESSMTSKDSEVPSKRVDKYEKARNRKAQKTKKRQDTQNKISKKRKNAAKRSLRQATPPQPDEEQVAEEPVESPPISVEDPSSKDGTASDDDVVLIEKPIELIPVEDSDEEVEDIQLGVEPPSDERQDSHADDAQSNAVEKMPDKPAGEAPIDLDLVYANLTNDPSKWQISRKDKPFYVTLEQRQRTKGPRCNKCRHFGHTALKCTEKPEPPRCYLCGDGNHTEPRCPNKICLNCGNKGDYTTNYCYRCFKFRDLQCRLCSQPGHLATGCPDLWRRYHMTTEPGPIKVPAGPQLKPRNDQWCSGCASRGHLEHECYYYGRQYPPALPYIINYDNVLYPDDAQRSVASTKETPEKSMNSDAVSEATHSKDNLGKRAPKHKTPNERSEQTGNSSKDIGHTPQKRTKCLNEAQIVAGVASQPEESSRNRDLQTEGPAVTNPPATLGEPINTLPVSRLFNLAGYRLQPRVDPEMRLFSIAGYGIPPAVADEVTPNRNAVNAPAGIWPRRDLMAVNETVPEPPAPAVTAPPSLLSLQFPPDFALGAFDRLPTGDELLALEDHGLGVEQEVNYQDRAAIEYRLSPVHNQKMKEYFLTARAADLKTFVSSELKKLNTVKKSNLEHLKKEITLAMRQQRAMKLNRNPHSKKRTKEFHEKVCRRTNMFLFGVHQMLLGQKHRIVLNRLTKGKKNPEQVIPRRQRMSCYLSYDYIFSEELKHGINYVDLLDKLIIRKQKRKRLMRRRQLARV